MTTVLPRGSQSESFLDWRGLSFGHLWQPSMVRRMGFTQANEEESSNLMPSCMKVRLSPWPRVQYLSKYSGVVSSQRSRYEMNLAWIVDYDVCL